METDLHVLGGADRRLLLYHGEPRNGTATGAAFACGAERTRKPAGPVYELGGRLLSIQPVSDDRRVAVRAVPRCGTAGSECSRTHLPGVYLDSHAAGHSRPDYGGHSGGGNVESQC